MMSAADVRALVVTQDQYLTSLFSGISRELGIVVDVFEGEKATFPEFGREKYEALVIDFDCVHDAGLGLAAFRRSPSNKNAVVFAVATESYEKKLALQHGATFILQRPLEVKDVRRAIYAAYDAMTRERRRYFRCSAELPVVLSRADGSDLVARTSNVSSNGMSIRSVVSFKLGERVGIALDLQNGGPQVLAHGTIVWDDRHGKSGISFQCVRPELQRILNDWLDARFSRMRELATHELQRAGAGSHPGR
jgi:DNA-binding response OmpR family regulator